MKTKELKKIMFTCNNGSPELRLNRAAESKLRLSQEITRLRDKAAGQCGEFGQRLEAWTSTHVNSTRRPLTIEQDRRDARLINAIAWVLTVTELALTFFMASVFGIPPLFLLLLAIVAIFALKAGLLAIWRNEMLPQETKRRLRNVVIIPSLIVTVLSAAVLIFARGVGGVLALLLLPFLNLALCALSLGCLGLAAGLFALGYLLLWSHYSEQRFNAVEREAIETLRVLRQVGKIEEELKTGRPGLSTSTALVSPNSLQAQTSQVGSPLSTQSKAIVRNGSSLLPLILLIAFHSAGCSLMSNGATASLTGSVPAPTSATREQSLSAAKTEPNTELEIWLDWSLSTEATAYREAVKALIAALLEVTAQHRVVRITAYQFGNNGWNASEILSLELPVPQQSEASEAAALFGQVRKEQEQQAQQQQSGQLREKLAGITESKLLPGQIKEPDCTDLQGVFGRIAENRRPQRRLVILLTDGHDTCSRQLRPVSLSSANAAVVVVLLPEYSRKKNQSLSYQTWEQTRAKLMQALPGAVVIPHFADPVSAISETLAKSAHQQSN